MLPTLLVALAASAAGRADAQTPVGQFRVLRSGIEGTGTSAPAPRPSVDTTPVRRLPVACGPARPCAAAWDLRVLSVVHPPQTAPEALIRTTVTVENAGRVAAPASEVRVCHTAIGYPCTDAVGGPVRVAIPALRPGEQFVVTRDVRALGAAQAGLGRTWVMAMVDFDGLTKETNRLNNGLRTDITVDLPDNAITTFNAAPESQGALALNAPLTLDVRVANRGAALTTPAADLELRSAEAGSQGNAIYCGNWGGETTRLQVPALAPGQAWTARVVVTGKAVSCKATSYTVAALLDPDRRVTWSRATRTAVSADYIVR